MIRLSVVYAEPVERCMFIGQSIIVPKVLCKFTDYLLKGEYKLIRIILIISRVLEELFAIQLYTGSSVPTLHRFKCITLHRFKCTTLHRFKCTTLHWFKCTIGEGRIFVHASYIALVY